MRYMLPLVKLASADIKETKVKLPPMQYSLQMAFYLFFYEDVHNLIAAIRFKSEKEMHFTTG